MVPPYTMLTSDCYRAYSPETNSHEWSHTCTNLQQADVWVTYKYLLSTLLLVRKFLFLKEGCGLGTLHIEFIIILVDGFSFFCDACTDWTTDKLSKIVNHHKYDDVSRISINYIHLCLLKSIITSYFLYIILINILIILYDMKNMKNSINIYCVV